jgi:predicted dehydrogenase
MNIAIIGANGSIAQTYREALRLLSVTHNLGVSAVIDTKPIGPEWGDIPYFSSLDAFLSSSMSADAIYVLTPPQTHAALATKAMGAGMHVLIEKPATLGVRSCINLINDCTRFGKTLFFAYHARYASGMPEMASLLADVPLSEIDVDYIEDVMRHRVSANPDLFPGAVWDSAVNAFSVIEMLFPNCGTLQASDHHVVLLEGVAIESSCTFRSDNLTIRFRQEWLSRKPVCRNIVVRTAEHGRHARTFTMDIHNQKTEVDGRVIHQGDPVNGYLQEYLGTQKHFLRCISTGQNFVPYGAIQMAQALQPIEQEAI